MATSGNWTGPLLSTDDSSIGFMDDLDVYETPKIDEVPTTLFRYCGVSGERLEWLRRIILKTEIYFPTVTSFNDPLDCRIPFNFSEQSASWVQDFWRKEHLRRRGTSEEDYERYLRKLIANTRTVAGREKLSQRLYNGIAERMGILCLSTVDTSVLMWSYYSEGHRGVVLRFNTSAPILRRMQEFAPMQVRYARAFPKVDYYTAGSEERLRTAFGVKSVDWKHEQEYRLISRQGPGSYILNPQLITGLIFGLNIDPEDERKIRGFAKERSIPIPLFRMQLRTGTFDLEVISADQSHPASAS